MPEKDFQKALIHLYTNIDRYSSYSDAIFQNFPLSCAEKQSLRELMAFQRDRLLVFNEQLHSKRRRAILHALPKSREIVSRQLDTLLDAYISSRAREGTSNPEDAVRSFENFVSNQIEGGTDASKELEFIRFEAAYASVSLPLAPANQEAGPPKLSVGLRLSLDGAALVRCNYDVLSPMKDPSLLKTSEVLLEPCWFFLFQTSASEVRVLNVAPGLAGVLKMFFSGSALGEIFQTLESDTRKIAASASIERLLLLGAPFSCNDAPVDRFRSRTLSHE